MAAGYPLQYHPGGDISVLVESEDGVPRDWLIYQPMDTSVPPRS
jgi:hypothetical protein